MVISHLSTYLDSVAIIRAVVSLHGRRSGFQLGLSSHSSHFRCRRSPPLLGMPPIPDNEQSEIRALPVDVHI